MRSAVIVFPGSNCDRDVAVALEAISGTKPVMVWHRETELPPVDLIVLPGGFSYGDYLRTGAMAAHSPVMAAVRAASVQGRAVLGICNGFQILAEAGLLPGVLVRNRSLKYINRFIHTRVETSQSIFTAKYEMGSVIRVPIAHGEGCYYAEAAVLDQLEDNGLIAFRYCDEYGKVCSAANPNGSLRHIAGVFNEKRNVLGYMPHPERVCDAALGGTDGRAMFESLLGAFA
jgi:phosphoribosylformylglycinamidine synthase